MPFAVVIGAALSLCLVAVPGCSNPTDQTTSTQTAGYAVVVRDGARTLGRFDLRALGAMPQKEIATPQSQGKQIQRGPLVRTVLTRAGVERFNVLRAVGRRIAQTFSAAEIDDTVLLDFDKAATVKLAGPKLPQSRWVQDLIELDVDP